MAKIAQKPSKGIRKKKKTSIGNSPFTRFNSKNDKNSKKKYRGQGKAS